MCATSLVEILDTNEGRFCLNCGGEVLPEHSASTNLPQREPGDAARAAHAIPRRSAKPLALKVTPAQTKKTAVAVRVKQADFAPNYQLVRHAL